jgi:hypothetical protein
MRNLTIEKIIVQLVNGWSLANYIPSDSISLDRIKEAALSKHNFPSITEDVDAMSVVPPDYAPLYEDSLILLVSAGGAKVQLVTFANTTPLSEDMLEQLSSMLTSLKPDLKVSTSNSSLSSRKGVLKKSFANLDLLVELSLRSDTKYPSMSLYSDSDLVPALLALDLPELVLNIPKIISDIAGLSISEKSSFNVQTNK